MNESPGRSSSQTKPGQVLKFITKLVIMATTTNTNRAELSHAAHCLDLYLNNTSEIYSRYTLPIIAKTVAGYHANNGMIAEPDATNNLTFWLSWQPEVKKALQAAARLVRKHDHMTPTQEDTEAVKADYIAYIIECAQYEYKTSKQ